MLNSVQRGFAQKIVRSHRTVSLSAALVLAGLLPLDMQVRETAILYEAKRGKSQSIMGDREIEGKVSYTMAPHPAVETGVDFVCLEDMQPQTLKHNNISGSHIFTDGSKIQGKVGAALSYWREGTERVYKKFKLESYCTVFQAEMYALLQATELVLKGKDVQINIFSDSRSALELLNSHDSYHPLVLQIKENLARIAKQNKKLGLFWIRAHVGVEGNERADVLAKDAALHKKTAPNNDQCPISFIKRTIRQDTLQNWNIRYNEKETASTTKAFFPDIIVAHKIMRKIKLSPSITQTLTGHGGFGQYLHRFKCKDDPSCICDPAEEESSLHLIVDCPRYGQRRMDLEHMLDMKVTKSNLTEQLKRGDCFWSLLNT
ncbi:hypothetical protein O0L34_g19238 [Tuta absoluta]|nr:hypothetical protein O0L34_g19238 [Tuta absoluta]